MSDDPKHNLFGFQTTMIAYVAILIAALVMNVISYVRLSDQRERKASLSSRLELEKVIANELESWKTRFSRCESENQLVEHGLKELYLTQCRNLDDFVPVFDDAIVTCRVKRRSIGYHSYHGMVHVPEEGNHSIKVEAAIKNRKTGNKEVYWLSLIHI